jgi:CyaY protein
MKTNFRKRADSALESLKKALMQAEESSEIEVEDQSGALHVSFDDRSKFVISPNAPVRQIWISALATSFKLDWSDYRAGFCVVQDRRAAQGPGISIDQSAVGRRRGHARLVCATYPTISFSDGRQSAGRETFHSR